MPHALAGYFNYKDADFADIFSRAEDGDLEAIAIGANILLQGFGHSLTNSQIKIDAQLAREWLEQGAAIEATNSDNERLCSVMLAMIQADNIGKISKKEQKDGRDTLVKNRNWIIAHAEADHATALRILSFMHARGGFGVMHNTDKAIELLKRAAEKNDPFALYDLGIIYTGKPRMSDRDHQQAAGYLIRAALLGHADAQREVDAITAAAANDASGATRPADTSQTSDKKNKKDKGNKHDR